MAQRAAAGVADTALPVLDPGLPTYHVFTVPGVIKNNNLETEFLCTSLSTAAVRVGVEVFDAAGTLLNNVASGVGDGAEDVSPGGTVTIATGNTTAIHEDEVIGLSSGSVKNGSARVVATSRLLTCTVLVVDKYGARTCNGSASDPAQEGRSCTADLDCGSGVAPDTGCLGFGAGCCEAVPGSMAALKVLKGKRQKGE
jgi:hypothetical protein